MIENRKDKHCNKPNWMGEEIVLILILVYFGGFRCSMCYYREYVCKYLNGLFSNLYSLTIFIKKVLWSTCTGTTFWEPLLHVFRNQWILFIKHSKGLSNVENVL